MPATEEQIIAGILKHHTEIFLYHLRTGAQNRVLRKDRERISEAVSHWGKLNPTPTIRDAIDGILRDWRAATDPYDSYIEFGERRSNYELYPGVIEHASAETLSYVWRDYANYLLKRGHATSRELAALHAIRHRWADRLGICFAEDDN